MRTRTITLLVAAALGVGACGDDNSDSASTPSAPAAAQAAAIEISKDRSSKPEIPKPSGDPPAKLAVRDVVKGSGATAKVDDTVSVHYVGTTYSTGEEFDASWNRGQPAAFQLSKGQLIGGWVDGIPGMKVGGRRLLVIPPDLAYGPEGRPPAIGPNETLVFVIDLLNRTPAAG